MASERRIYCNRCKNYTRNILRANYEQEFYPGEYPEMEMEYAKGEWQIWQCLGCDDVVFLEVWVTSEDQDPLSGKIIPTEHLYPERNNSKPAHIIESKEFEHIPAHLDALYHEVINSFNNGSGILCAVGLRALIEGICIDKGIIKGPNDKGKIVKTLDGKINAMKSIVPENITKNLHGFRFMGNDAVHQLAMPPITDLALAITIAEDILNIVYDLNYTTSRLFQRTNKAKSSSPAPSPTLPQGPKSSSIS